MKIVHQGQCTCGKVSITTLTAPMLVYNCHCSHCRGFCHEEYSQASMFWSMAVIADGPIQWETTSAAGFWGNVIGLKRGRCHDCKDPVMERGVKAIGIISFVSANLLKLNPTYNIMYDSGYKKGEMGLPTIYSDLASMTVPTIFLIHPGISQLIWMALGRLSEFFGLAEPTKTKDE